MEVISIHELKNKKTFIEEVRWDLTPKTLMGPGDRGTDKTDEAPENTDGFMFYIEVVGRKPVLVIMKSRFSMSQTAAYVTDVPDDLLREAARCSPEECLAGMYPLTEKLEKWLKKELGVL
jgi:hypothetical protein